MVLLVVAALILIRLVAELFLATLNRREVRRHAAAPPAAAAAIMDAATYRRSVAYTLEKSHFSAVTDIFDSLLLGLILFGGIMPALFNRIAATGNLDAMWDDALFVLAAGILISIPGLPFDWWAQFRLEQKYGFNKSSGKLWIVDKIKGLALVLIIGFPLLWLLLRLVAWAGDLWWIWGFAVLFGFQLLMIVLYPKLILPLFNKLAPLPEGPLKDRLMALADRTGFHARTIEVMDGSKRSGHSNAFFTGFGRFRRIVLFDTLIAQLAPEELEAVLAHEIGHYRLGHIPKGLALAAVFQFVGFGVVAWLARQWWFNTAFGFPTDTLAPAFLLFGLLSGLVTFWLTPVFNWRSRKHEYEADAFARDAMHSAAPMVAALRKLAEKNLTNLTPHRWYSAFYYSHPTIVERERALTAE